MEPPTTADAATKMNSREDQTFGEREELLIPKTNLPGGCGMIGSPAGGLAGRVGCDS